MWEIGDGDKACMRKREFRWLRFVPAFVALLIAAIACNLPGIGQEEEGETPTPFIVFVTATPEGPVEATPCSVCLAHR